MEHLVRRVGVGSMLPRASVPILLVAAASPALLFPEQCPAWLVWLAVAMAIGQEIDGGWLSRQPLRSPIDLALGVFCVTALVGIVVSPAPDLTLPKSTGLLLGVASLRVVVRLVRSPLGVWRAAYVCLFLALLMVFVGLLETVWVEKIQLLTQLTERVPTLDLLPGRVDVNSNALGAVTLCVLPLASMLWLWSLGRDALESRGPRQESSVHPEPFFLHRRSRQAVFGVVWVGTAAVLVLSQSRSAWLGAGTALAVLAVAHYRRSPLLPFAVAILLVTGAVWTPFLGGGASSAGAGLSLEARREVWIRAGWAISDFPLTGVGLGAFRRVVTILYPMLESQDTDVAHAHNQVLQTALDVGVPGLIASVAILILCGVCCRRVIADGDRRTRMVVLGLAGNLLAVQVFGLTDAISLGAKIGWCSWIAVGLIVAAARSVQRV